MPKKKKNDAVPCCADKSYEKERKERQEKEFKRDYSFTKPRPVRSPANSDWEHDRISKNTPYYGDVSPYLPKEQALYSGKPSSFGAKKDGNLRLSGTKGAHRIGKK